MQKHLNGRGEAIPPYQNQNFSDLLQKIFDKILDVDRLVTKNFLSHVLIGVGGFFFKDGQMFVFLIYQFQLFY